MTASRLCSGATAGSPVCYHLAVPGTSRCVTCTAERAGIRTEHPYSDPVYRANARTVRANAGDHCPRCVEPYTPTNPVTVEHVVAVEFGGTHEPDNLAPLCRRCNSSLGAAVRGTEGTQRQW